MNNIEKNIYIICAKNIKHIET